MKLFLKSFMVTVLLCAARVSAAVPLDSIVAKNTFPIAPRGGVLMVRLLSSELGNEWPSTIPVVFEDGTTADGVVGWIEIKEHSTGWTDESVFVRPIEMTDSTASTNPRDTISGPILLVELPKNGTGSIYFGGESVVPKWVDLPSQFPSFDFSKTEKTGTLTFLEANYLPPTNALHYWRWVLLASKNNVNPPVIPNANRVEKLSALHGEQLWRIAFHNLSIASRGAGAACLDLLTDTSMDEDHRFACWVESQTKLEKLLSILLDETLTSKQLAYRALRWSDAQSKSLFWFTSLFGASVTVKVANSKPETSLCQLAWEGEDEIPLAFEIPARKTVSMNLKRPKALDLSVFGPVVTPPVQKLVLSMPNRMAIFPVENGVIKAKPPHVKLPPLVPTWTLSSLRHGYARRVSQNQKTEVEVRYVLGSWEIFIACHGSANDSEIDQETVSLFFSSLSEPIVITPKTNALSHFQIFTETTDVGWNSRVVVPNSVIQNGKLSFSVVRTHGENDNIETSPLPCVPWDINPAPIVIDTTHWNTIDNIPITPDPE
ncbi:MAG: hypothetical protein H8E91_04945 [Planctomycetes bacterium]|nr:hypothetical protein [Planctomycetota bacterium]